MNRALRTIERSFVYRRSWIAFGSGFFEPLFYLLIFGLILGTYIGAVDGPDGTPVAYATFVAPALIAVAVANGSVYGATAIFGKLQFGTVYRAMLATPIGPKDIASGELLYATFRGLLYGLMFLVAGALLGAAEVVPLAVPATALVAFAFSGAALAVTVYLRSYQELAVIEVVLFGLVLLSGTLFPVSVLPSPLRVLIELTPLHHAISLVRGIELGSLGMAQLVNAGYLLALGVGGLVVARRRIGVMLLGRA